MFFPKCFHVSLFSSCPNETVHFYTKTPLGRAHYSRISNKQVDDIKKQKNKTLLLSHWEDQ